MNGVGVAGRGGAGWGGHVVIAAVRRGWGRRRREGHGRGGAGGVWRGALGGRPQRSPRGDAAGGVATAAATALSFRSGAAPTAPRKRKRGSAPSSSSSLSSSSESSPSPPAPRFGRFVFVARGMKSTFCSPVHPSKETSSSWVSATPSRMS